MTKRERRYYINDSSYTNFPAIESNNRQIVESPLIYDKDLKEYFLDVNHFNSLCERDDVHVHPLHPHIQPAKSGQEKNCKLSKTSAQQ